MRAIGIDIGTSSICATVYDSCSGAQLAVENLPNDNYISFQEPWRKEQRADNILSSCKILADSLIDRFGPVDAIGLTGQMHGIVYLDSECNALSNLVTWEDGRGDLPYKEGLSYAEYISTQTGKLMATGYGLTTCFYDLINGQIPENTVSICTIMDYVGRKLAGTTEGLMHYSNAAAMGLFDLESMSFDTEAVEKLGIDLAMLPTACSEKIIGSYRDIPVTVALGDNQAGVAGVLEKEEDIVVSLGTSWQVSAVTEKSSNDCGMETRPYVDGRYIVLDYGLCGGRAINALNDFFRQICQPWADVSKADMYTWMNSVMDRYEQFDQLPVVDTAFRGTRKNPEKRAGISMLSLDNFRPESLVIAFYQGLCRDICNTADKISNLRARSGRLIITGNVARRSKSVLKMLDDMWDMDIVLAEAAEETALGAAKTAIITVENNFC